MIDNDTLDVGETDGYVWVRINGKGSFNSSPPLKGFVERRIESGETRFVIDLGDCPAMDSTFMGTLAGLAMRLAKSSGGRLQLNGVCGGSSSAVRGQRGECEEIRDGPRRAGAAVGRGLMGGGLSDLDGINFCQLDSCRALYCQSRW